MYHGEERPEDAKRIQVERAVLDVIVLKLESLSVTYIGSSVAAPPSGDARSYLVIQSQSIVLFELAFDKRSRPYDRHVSLYDVDKLRELVQRSLAQELSYAGDSRIVVELLVLLPLLAVFILLQELFQSFIGMRDHRPELDHFELLAVLTYALMRIEDRRGITCDQVGDLDADSQRDQRQNAYEAEHYVRQLR